MSTSNLWMLDNLEAEVIAPTFKDFKNGKHKFISFYAKKARGMMADFHSA